MGFDIRKVLSAVAPMIGTALGGPLGGAAASTLVKALGLKADPNNPQAVEDEIANYTLQSADLLKLKEAEMQFQKDMAELNIKSVEDLEKIAADDRASARQRETAVRDWTPRFLAFIIVGAFIGTILTVLMGWSRAEGALAGTLIGYISAKAEQVVAYYFGSSAGSDRKTELLSQAPSINDKGGK